MTDNDESDMRLEKNRLEALTDGIFAFAMTLLVASLILPRSAIITGTSIEAFFSLVPDFYHYIIGFFVLSAFWIAHHMQFRHVRFIDRNFLGLSTLGLFFVTLVPFSTSFVGDFIDPFSSIIFETNLLILGLLFFFQWLYATHNHRLVAPEHQKQRIRYGLARNLIIPVISMLGIILALAGFSSSTMVYMLSPLASYGVRKYFGE